MSEFCIKIVIIISALVVAGGAKLVMHLKDDNAIEEVAECIIKQESGYDIDLTPDSPEALEKEKV
jgi:hypothetical protein